MKAYFLIAAAMMVVLAGCSSTSTPKVVEIHKGTDGLEISFMERSPPDEVYLGERFPVSFEINNKGAYDITDGVLALGVEQDYVSVENKEYVDKNKPYTFSINGRSTYDPIGGMDRKTIELTAARLGPQAQTHTTIVSLTACYAYKTEATATVCIDTDIFGQRNEEKPCTASTLSMGTIKTGGEQLPSGQGAPIAITKIEQKMLPHETEGYVKPQYEIFVKNMGNGIPVASGYYQEACKATGAAAGFLNVVSAKVYLSDRAYQMDCSPKLAALAQDLTGHIKLEKDEDVIKCVLKQGIPKSMGTYTTPLMIELDYGYTFTISKNVLIKKIIN